MKKINNFYLFFPIYSFGSQIAVIHNLFRYCSYIFHHFSLFWILFLRNYLVYFDWFFFYYYFQIMRSDRTLEQIVFPIRDTCLYLTPETKQRVYYTAQLDLQGSKVSDFFKQFKDMHNEMKWQRTLKGIFFAYCFI